MRAVTDGRLELTGEVRRHLDLCLDCRACETACPSGVQYGKLIEPFRIEMEKTRPDKDRLGVLQRFLLFHVTPYARRMRLALVPARLMQRTGIDGALQASGLLRWLPQSLQQLHEMLPPLAKREKLPAFLPAEGKRRATVALFTGCASAAFFPETNVATARVLQKNGCNVIVPRDQGCCGALHYHAARPARARELATTNIRSFCGQKIDAIIVNAAGCGAVMKEYGHLFADLPGSTGLAKKVRDISEFLVELGPIKPAHPLPIKAVYHDACHLCHAQQIRKQPRALLELIPGLEVVPLPESELCCGAAGSYNLTEPEMAERLGLRKAEHILATGASAIFAGNVGCLLQIGKHVRRRMPGMWIAHPVDALWAAYTGAKSRA
jgi:glycolate oxidase iron-sulfur subunit